jgi:hypothetical protein
MSVSFDTACEKAGVAAKQSAVSSAGRQVNGRIDRGFMAFLEMREVWLIGTTYKTCKSARSRAIAFQGILTRGGAKANRGRVKIDAVSGRRGGRAALGRPPGGGMPARRKKPLKSD